MGKSEKKETGQKQKITYFCPFGHTCRSEFQCCILWNKNDGCSIVKIYFILQSLLDEIKSIHRGGVS